MRIIILNLFLNFTQCTEYIYSTFVEQMERLRGTTMNQRVHKAMEYWLEAIKYVQECRKQEIANAIKRQKENPHCILAYDDNGECYN